MARAYMHIPKVKEALSQEDVASGRVGQADIFVVFGSVRRAQQASPRQPAPHKCLPRAPAALRWRHLAQSTAGGLSNRKVGKWLDKSTAASACPPRCHSHATCASARRRRNSLRRAGLQCPQVLRRYTTSHVRALDIHHQQPAALFDLVFLISFIPNSEFFTRCKPIYLLQRRVW
jgi:hypothetical protein